MNIADHRQRFRKSSPFSTRNRGVTSQATESDISFGQVSGVPNEMRPGTFAAQVVIDVHPDAFSRITDPDYCDMGFFKKGFSVKVSALVDGVEVASEIECIGYDDTWDFVIPIEEEGSHTVTFQLTGGNSGNDIDSRSFGVTVDEESDDNGGSVGPGNGDNGDNGGSGGPWLPCFIDPNHSCGTMETGAYFAALTLFLVVVVSSR